MALGSTTYRIGPGWFTAVTAGAPSTQDAATITDPSSIDGAEKLRFVIPEWADGFKVRLAYDTTTTAITTNLGIKVAGRILSDPYDANSSAGNWQIVQNRNQVSSVTITAVPATDIDSGGMSRTAIDEFNCVFHRSGLNEFVIGVETAFSPTDGSSSTPFIEVMPLKYER